MFDIYKYLSKGVLSFGAISLYDYFVEGKNMDYIKDTIFGCNLQTFLNKHNLITLCIWSPNDLATSVNS